MKFLLSFVLLLSSASSFSPLSSSSSSSARRVTPTHQKMVYDPEAMYHVALNAGDAVRLVFLECNGQECHLVDGWKEGAHWQFEDRPSAFPDHTPGHRLEVLMAEMDTTE